MKPINHHLPESMLVAYAAGNLPQAFGLVVASHISMCLECRSRYEAHEALGGAVLDDMSEVDVSDDLKQSVLDLLDAPVQPEPAYCRSGVYPGPVMAALKGSKPRWKTLGAGVRQSIVSADDGGSVRLLTIPPGQAMPDHGHHGMELTLVLHGSFSDETGTFRVGDVEVADDDLEHTPVADAGEIGRAHV